MVRCSCYNLKLIENIIFDTALLNVPVVNESCKQILKKKNIPIPSANGVFESREGR